MSNVSVELDDFRSLSGLVQQMRKEGVTARLVELLYFLRRPRRPLEVESGIDMDRWTLNNFARNNPGLIHKVSVDAEPRERGKPPVLYGVTPEGANLLQRLNAVVMWPERIDN